MIDFSVCGSVAVLYQCGDAVRQSPGRAGRCESVRLQLHDERH